MFGLGIAPSDPDNSLGGLELRGDDPGDPVGGDPLDLDVLERVGVGVAEPLADPLGVPGDLEAVEVEVAARTRARVLDALLPLDEERQLRVGLEALHAELAPLELHAVGTVPVAQDRLSAEALLVRRDVLDGDDPAHPAAAALGAGPDGLAERRLVGGGVVEYLDDLEVRACTERQDHVARAEAGVDPPVTELLAE